MIMSMRHNTFSEIFVSIRSVDNLFQNGLSHSVSCTSTSSGSNVLFLVNVVKVGHPVR